MSTVQIHLTSKLLARDNNGLRMSGTWIGNSRQKHDTKTIVFSDLVFCTFTNSAGQCSTNCMLSHISLSTKGPDITPEFSQVVWVKYYWSPVKTGSIFKRLTVRLRNMYSGRNSGFLTHNILLSEYQNSDKCLSITRRHNSASVCHCSHKRKFQHLNYRSH